MYHGPGRMLEGSALLQKWLKDAIASAKKCIVNNGGQVSLIYSQGKRCDLTRSVKLPDVGADNAAGKGSAQAKTRIGGQQTKLPQ